MTAPSPGVRENCPTCGGDGEVANYKHPLNERYGKPAEPRDDMWGAPVDCPQCHGIGSITQECQTCRFALRPYWVCRRYPPIMREHPPTYPKIFPHFWCGEYQSTPEAPHD